MLKPLPNRLPDNAHTRAYLENFFPLAEEYVKTPPIALSYMKFSLFAETGSRVEYETDYFEHRKRMDVLWAMVMLGKNEYLPAFCDILNAILEEYTWALPAHVTGAKTVGELVTRIDLFAAETAGALSDILCECKDVLPEPLKARIRYELMRRVVTPYLEKPQRWGRNNWSAVCANGVINTFLRLGLFEEFERAKKNLLASLDLFLDSYQNDGCCTEGALYWSYGFGNFVYAASLLRDHSDGAIDYFALPKVKAAAKFGFAVYLGENLTVPYSDGPHRLNFNIGLYHFLKKEYPDLPLPDERFEARLGDEERCRFADISRNLLWYDETLAPSPVLPERVDYPETQWYIRSRYGFSFSCKGGHNGESHNHNDVGSFFVLKDGQFLLDDLGWPEYDGGYFGSRRYKDYVCAMSEGHSLPILDGQPQKAGAEFAAKVIRADRERIVMDLSGAYDLPGLHFVRVWSLDCQSVTITDAIAGVSEITERFVTRIKPVVSDGAVRIAGAELLPVIPAEPKLSKADFTPRLVCHLGMEERETAHFIDYSYHGDGTFGFTLTL